MTQFMSSKTNFRTDKYRKPLALLRRIVAEIRTVVPSTFVLGIKFNAGDYVADSISNGMALEHINEDRKSVV